MNYFSHHFFSDPPKKSLDCSLWFCIGYALMHTHIISNQGEDVSSEAISSGLERHGQLHSGCLVSVTVVTVTAGGGGSPALYAGEAVIRD